VTRRKNLPAGEHLGDVSASGNQWTKELALDVVMECQVVGEDFATLKGLLGKPMRPAMGRCGTPCTNWMWPNWNRKPRAGLGKCGVSRREDPSEATLQVVTMVAQTLKQVMGNSAW